MLQPTPRLSHPFHLPRFDLGGQVGSKPARSLLNLLHLSDAHVIDTVSPARAEWIELLAHEPHWQGMLHMHRPYEALTHWTLAAHVQRQRLQPLAPWSGRPFDLALSTGDNIDNAQANELTTYLTILGGGHTALSAFGGVQDPSSVSGAAPWPFWCPNPDVPDRWKPQGYPAMADFLARCSAPVVSPGLGLPWASLPGNHDVMRQGMAWPDPASEQIATGTAKALARPAGFQPADPEAAFLAAPAAFSMGAGRTIPANPARRAVRMTDWLQAHVAQGALGYGPAHVRQRCSDTVIDTEHARLILLDTNHPGGNYQGSVGQQQLAWLEQRLAEVETGRIAILASHHGSASLTNTHGDAAGRLHAQALTTVAHRHACVVAWLVGHRHLHQITPHPGPSGGFWEITTASLIDWPCQTRAVEFLRHSNGSIEIVCSLLDHQAAPGTLAALHHQLARQFAGPMSAHLQGGPGDGHVRLMRP